jgi:hypothetical protein
VNYTNPPEFIWSNFADPNQGDAQYAYQVQVVNNFEGVCDSFNNPYYDSGEIPSTDNYHIATTPLDSAYKYCWRIRVQDDSARQLWSDWSLCDNGFTVDSNLRPVADAGTNQTYIVGTDINIGGSINLDGSGSSDPDDCLGGDSSGTCLNYEWSFDVRPSGSSAVIDNNNTFKPSFIADSAGVYVIRLKVTDKDGAEDEDSVRYTLAVPTACGDGMYNSAEEQCDESDLAGGDTSCPGYCYLCTCINWQWWEIHPFKE